MKGVLKHHTYGDFKQHMKVIYCINIVLSL